ncbi:MAG: DUF58 domain-containing protein [Gammaproteobacteria bacterium AqS3]|nr:DUF58 domain-containing protein [Gammaproteobacteria bacterium AqS3]
MYVQQPVQGGIQPVGGTQIRRQDLLNQRRFAMRIDEAGRRRSRALRQGGAPSIKRGDGLELDEIRAFQQGDNPRHIDWRVTARSGDLHTKQYRQENETPVYLLLDLSPSMNFGSVHSFKSVLAAQLAALIGWSYRRSRRRLGAVVRINGELHGIRAGEDDALMHLFAIACGAVQGARMQAERFADALNLFAQLCHGGADAYIISDFQGLDEDCDTPLTLLRRYGGFAIRVRDALEILPPNDSLPIRTGSGKSWVSRGRLAQHLEELDARFEHAAMQGALNVQEFCTGEDLSAVKAVL